MNLDGDPCAAMLLRITFLMVRCRIYLSWYFSDSKFSTQIALAYSFAGTKKGYLSHSGKLAEYLSGLFKEHCMRKPMKRYK